MLSDTGTALCVAEQCCPLTAAEAITHETLPVAAALTVSMSVGTALSAAGDPPRSLIAEVDRSLHLAKQRCRNRFVAVERSYS